MLAVLSVLRQRAQHFGEVLMRQLDLRHEPAQPGIWLALLSLAPTQDCRLGVDRIDRRPEQRLRQATSYTDWSATGRLRQTAISPDTSCLGYVAVA